MAINKRKDACSFGWGMDEFIVGEYYSIPFVEKEN